MIVCATAYCIQGAVGYPVGRLYSRSRHQQGLKVKLGTRTPASFQQRKPEALLVRIVNDKNGFAVGEIIGFLISRMDDINGLPLMKSVVFTIQ